MTKPVVLVTGGSRGIGYAIAKKLHANGWKVAITSRDLGRAQQVASEIAEDVLGVEYEAPFRLQDQTVSAEARVVERVNEKLGTISALVNAAGISKDNLLLRLKLNDLDDLMLTNLYGPIQMSKVVLKGMIQQHKGEFNYYDIKFMYSYIVLDVGSIVTLGSVVGSQGNIGQTAYSASKAALIGVTHSMAKEVGNRNIRVNLVEPGFIETDMTASMSEKAKEKILRNIPLNRFGQAEEVANLVEFLVSDNGSYITGQCIRVDGGLII
jgi:3-oxoacyl-[acyl-carrier protein] reductase